MDDWTPTAEGFSYWRGIPMTKASVRALEGIAESDLDELAERLRAATDEALSDEDA